MDTLLDFVGELYEASLEPRRWDSVMARLCNMIGARSGGINVEDHVLRQRYMIATHGMPAAAKLTYRLGMAKHDHIFKIQESRPVGRAALVARHEEMKKSHAIYYRFIMKPLNMGYVAAIGLFNDEEWHAGIGVHRGFDAEPFGDRELRLLDTLAPHFQRALRIHRELHRLRSRADSLESALSRLIMGILVVDPTQGVVFRNAAAEAVLNKHPALTIGDGLPAAHYPEERRELQRLLSELFGADPRDVKTRNQAIALRHPDRDQPLLVMMAPLGHGNLPDGVEAGTGRVLLYLSDPESSFSMPTDTLHSLYGLTPAEAGVAILLANGLTTKEIASKNGVGQETVRSQLKAIYAKMDARNQQDVIRLLLGHGAALTSA